MEKLCKNCALYNQEQKVCMRAGVPQAPEDHCSSFIKDISLCELCGRPLFSPFSYLYENEKIIKVCGSCFSRRNTCGLCTNTQTCDFQSNPIGLPQMVEQTIQKGNMIIQQSIPNPERIEATCKANCACWNHEMNCCNRQFQTCGSFNPIFS